MKTKSINLIPGPRSSVPVLFLASNSPLAAVWPSLAEILCEALSEIDEFDLTVVHFVIPEGPVHGVVIMHKIYAISPKVNK